MSISTESTSRKLKAGTRKLKPIPSMPLPRQLGEGGRVGIPMGELLAWEQDVAEAQAYNSEILQQDPLQQASMSSVTGLTRGVMATALTEAQDRVLELITIGKQAARLGVQFDVAQAISEGIEPSAARIAILERAYMQDQEIGETCTFTHSVSAIEQNKQAIIRAGQDRALQRVAERKGLPLSIRAAPEVNFA